MSIDAVNVYESTTFTQENLKSIEWDENYFKWCHFEDFSFDAILIASDFVDCSFKNLDWYGGLFSDCNFINCEFENCIFQGTAFPGNRFVECKINNCKFITNNMARECDFEHAVAYSCTIEGSESFNADVR